MRAKDAALLLMGRTGLEFMSSAATAPDAASIPVTKPAGVQVDDLVFVWALDTTNTSALTTSGGSAWSFQRVAISSGSANGFATLYWKILNATDVANQWSHTGASAHGIQALRYRANGANAVASKATTSNAAGTTTLSLAGFARAGGHYAALAFFGAPSSAGQAGIVTPSGFTQRRRDSGSGITGTYVGIAADNLGGYQDGAAVQFSNCDSAATEYGILVEVTGP